MSKKIEPKTEEGIKPCCTLSDEEEPCCHVEAMVQVDSKGQIYLPKTLRESMDLKENDKLAVVVMKTEGKISSISLFKADKLDDAARILLRL